MGGAEGLFLSEECVYDVICSTSCLHVFREKTLLETLRSRGSEIPVLLLTAKEGKANIIAYCMPARTTNWPSLLICEKCWQGSKAVVRRNKGRTSQDSPSIRPHLEESAGALPVFLVSVLPKV
jgi:hypothetical protein